MEPFTIAIDAATRTMSVSVNTFWDDETSRRFVTELEESAELLSRTGRPTFQLVDISCSPPQSQTTAAMIQETVARMARSGATRVALVVPSALVAMQVRRISPDGDKVFTDRAAAERYLAECRAASTG